MAMAISYTWVFLWDYTFYKWGDLLLLITGISPKLHLIYETIFRLVNHHTSARWFLKTWEVSLMNLFGKTCN